MISAHDWIDNSTIDAAVLKRWPDYRVWLVATDDVDMSELAATADDLSEQAIDSARVLDDADDHVLRWQDAYRTFGVKPRTARSSIDALRRRWVPTTGSPRSTCWSTCTTRSRSSTAYRSVARTSTVTTVPPDCCLPADVSASFGPGYPDKLKPAARATGFFAAPD